MKNTKNLGLPIYDNPKSDLFKISDVNNAHTIIDETYETMKNAKDHIVEIDKNIPIKNADAEIVDARRGKSTLGEKIREIDLSLENITSKTSGYINITELGAKGNANYYDEVNKKYYEDKDLTILATDNTSIIQNALNNYDKIIIPPGNFMITSPLEIKIYGSILEGCSMETSKLIPCGDNVNCFCNTDKSKYIRTIFRDFSIIGKEDTGVGIYFDVNQVYQSRFENMNIVMGQQSMYITEHFSTSFYNIHFSSYKNHGIELEGGNSTVLINCYAHNMYANDKCGYRIWNSATMIGCNGVDRGDIWGIFGRNTGEDGNISQFNINIQGGNMEDFKKYAIRCKYNGSMNITQASFLAGSSDIETYIYVDYCDRLIKLDNVAFDSKGGKVTNGAEISSNARCNILLNGTKAKLNQNDVIMDIPYFYGERLGGTTDYILKADRVNFSELIAYIKPHPTLVTGNNFNAKNINVVITKNTVETEITNILGGVNGQELTILIQDNFTTIKEFVGGVGGLRLKSGQDIKCTDGQALKFIYNKSIWRQI